VAEWSCSGLQSRVRRFDSDPRLQNVTNYPQRSHPRNCILVGNPLLYPQK
jgi:hypothetical protein